MGFDTIPACWWWGTVSMTTEAGYGDVVPVAGGGKLAASGAASWGASWLWRSPSPIIFNKFSHFYRRQKALEAARAQLSDHRGLGTC